MLQNLAQRVRMNHLPSRRKRHMNPCRRRSRVSPRQRQPVARMNRYLFQPPVRPLLLCRQWPASGCHRHFRNRLSTRRRCRPVDLPAGPHLSRPTHRRRHPRASPLRTVTRLKRQRRAVAGTGLVMAVLRADTRRDNRMVRNRMDTAMAVRREIGQTESPRTVRTRAGMVQTTARPDAPVGIPCIRTRRPGTDGLGYRMTSSTRITVNRSPTIGISPTIQLILRRLTGTSPS